MCWFVMPGVSHAAGDSTHPVGSAKLRHDPAKNADGVERASPLWVAGSPHAEEAAPPTRTISLGKRPRGGLAYRVLWAQRAAMTPQQKGTRMTLPAKSSLIVLLLTAALVVPVAPAWSADVTVNTVVATQYAPGFFIALVYAQGAHDLIDAQIAVNNVVVVPDKVEEYSASRPNNPTLWKIVKYARDVVKPGDTVTAIVTDTEGNSNSRTVTCGRGIVKLGLTAICR
jgi:hypothetical protein